MILGGLLIIIQTISDFIINLLPTADPTIVNQISSFGSTLRPYLVLGNWAFPFDTALLLLSLIVVIEVGILVVKIFRIIFHWS